jgi:2-hydroxychromene-2-carboxylate isomerase
MATARPNDENTSPSSFRTRMKADWYFDFISPFSYLQLGDIARLRQRIEITPVPIVLGAVLRHHGQLGPAEIPGKREFTYRHVQWTAERKGATLRFPPAHPFNPLAALRLAIAAGTTWDAIGAIFAHIWQHGRAGDDASSLAEVARALGIEDVAAAIAHDDVKTALRANTEAALAAGVFGVPTLGIGGELFWGHDATPMIEDWLDAPDRFSKGEYGRLSSLPRAMERRR